MYVELIDKRFIKENEAKQMLEIIKNESRKFSDEEETEYRNIIDEIKELNIQITKEEEVRNNNINNKTNKKMEFSILKAINEELEGRKYSEATETMLKEGQRSMSLAGQSYKGIVIPFEMRSDIIANGAIVAEQKLDLLEPLRAKLVATQAGATLLTGLVGDVSIPTYSGSTSNWKGETVVAEDGAGSFGEVELKPKRLTTYIEVSKQFLIQDSVSAEAMLRKDLVNSIAGKLEATIFGKDAASADKPAGLYTGVLDANLAVKGVASWANIVALEGGVDTNNALMGSLCYVTTPTAKSKLKSTQKGTNAGFIMEGNEMNGYPVYVTNNVAKGLATGANEEGIIFGNFSDLVIGQWGALDITVDPYTKAKEGKVVLVVNAYFDFKPRRIESFAMGSLK